MREVTFSEPDLTFDGIVRMAAEGVAEKDPGRQYVLVSWLRIVFLKSSEPYQPQILIDANVRFEKCEIAFGTTVLVRSGRSASFVECSLYDPWYGLGTVIENLSYLPVVLSDCSFGPWLVADNCQRGGILVVGDGSRGTMKVVSERIVTVS